MKISEIIDSGSGMLLSSGTENGFREAQELLSFVVGRELSYIRVRGDETVDKRDEERFFSLIEKRLSGYPLQYILGEWSFYNLDRLFVGEGVLIPRPETELLVDEALEFLKEKKDGTPEVFDLCSGSGCIAIAVALNAPWCHVTALEYSEKAFSYLERNASLYNLDNLTLVKGDIFDGPPAEADLIISNPPYIRTEDLEGLQKEVHFEPEKALDGGEDGLVFYRAIRDLWFSSLRSGGLVLMEIGEDQGDDLKCLFEDTSSRVEVKKDYSGLDRVVTAFREA